MSTTNPIATERVLIVGLGYVGLPIALRTVEAGYQVTGVEIDPRRFSMLQAGHSYVEDIDDATLRAAIATGRFEPVATIADSASFDIAVIAVPTPLRDGAPDLAFVIDAASEIGKLLKQGGCVVLESTTYPGTTEEVVGPLLEQFSGLEAGRDFHLGFSPERIDPGNEKWTLVTTPKIVSGINTDSLQRLTDFYSRIVDQVVPATTPRVAELAKLLENTYRHVNIALVNELAIFAKDLDINIWEVIDVASSKPFGFQPFTPGPGVGGHCLPIDPSYLSWQVRHRLGHPFRFIELANDVNEHMPDYVVRRIRDSLNDQCKSVRGARIVLMGVAYKKNSSDARESPAVTVAELLAKLGAELRIADPLAPPAATLPGTRIELSADELRAADLVVVLTDHDSFDWQEVLEHSSHIFDTRNRLTGDNVESL